MVPQATIDMLVGMKLTAMAAELSSQLQDASFNELGFEDRLGLLVTAEWNRRQTNTVARLIRNAHFAAPSAVVEGIAYTRFYGVPANKNRDHLLIVSAFLFSLFCLLDREHFNQM